jgi:hypothetical protein
MSERKGFLSQFLTFCQNQTDSSERWRIFSEKEIILEKDSNFWNMISEVISKMNMFEYRHLMMTVSKIIKEKKISSFSSPELNLLQESNIPENSKKIGFGIWYVFSQKIEFRHSTLKLEKVEAE